MAFPSSPYAYSGAPPASSPTRPSSFFSPGPGAPQVAPASSPTPGLDPAAPMFPNRKRRAPSPPPTQLDPQPSAWSHDTKRRRPNLANGFQAMSISPRPDDQPESWFPHGAVHDDTGGTDDDGLEPTLPPADGDVAVEELPDQSPTAARRRPRMPWHRNSSFSSTSPSEDDYDSDVTFRVPPPPVPLVQPSDIEHPPDDPEPTSASRYHSRHREPLPMPHVEVMETPVKRKGSGGDRDADGNGAPHSAKRRRQGMDVDMDTMPVSHGPGWYEPEKDRIVITSLSSPEPESPGGSPEPDSPSYTYEQYRKLAQPGSHGFTISPSLLTHILGAQRDQFGMQPMPQQEKGLVLYRPIANPPDPRDPRRQDPQRPRFGVSPAENVVQQWDDANRFEEVDDDEDFMSGTPVVGVPVGMDVDMNGGMGYGSEYGGGYGGGYGAGYGAGYGSANNEPADEAMEVE